ncbi:serine/threonine kinase IRE1 [Trichoderma atroviride IMI 206040]|uniref:non-specific serine/threonine protein kinase n=1 Tax=Hypocrea atroviridis (strain ATCC 20476 / IMI 206040) TaxID=452589 RepID=G9NFZ3_HYPAI|nr:serine/threonine kinase IRE1 [Trichoderma atroviride IMI 206040]EHK50205.1 serine/threonine kinase IRE1 [Trichoderma atroviride IMI 206040]
MLRRPPGQGRWSSQHQKLLLAFAIILIPWIQLVDAQQQPVQPQVQIHSQRGDSPLDSVSEDATNSQWYAAQVDDVRDEADFDTINKKQKQPRQQQQQPTPLPQQRQRARLPSDASALATLAPAQPVRAPHTSRHLWPSSSASGLASPQNARSLEDWEVEDFVLLATVDGDLYASDRKTGRQRWHLEVDQPVVETTHYRTNNSVLDDDYSPVDHYIWAVEPSRDGGLYVWIPDAGAGLIRTGFTMKRLVEELAPYAGDEPPVVYTGDKKTTMVTLDVATGRVLKWFGSGGSLVNEGESCLRPNAFGDADNEECSSMGTITLGRTEYTVGIQRRDGRPIATLKYAEWGPNTFDSDLYQQYHASLDSRYITSQHDGKVYAFDQSRSDNHLPLFSHKFSSPVARVFDVCRPWDAAAGSNPDLVVLPQPPMPSQDEGVAKMRSNSIFLNQTENGSWYALSGRAYPLIIDAPVAQISRPDWWDTAPAFDTINRSKISKALVGTHFLDALRSGSYQQQHLTLPPGLLDDFLDELENGSNNAHAVAPAVHEEPTIITKVKALPQNAANSVIDFVSNPVLIILFVGSLIYNEKKLRRAYHRFRTEGSLKDIYPFLTLDHSAGDESGDEKDATFSSSSSTTPLSQLDNQKVEEISKPKLESTTGDEDKDKDRDRDSSESSERAQNTDDKVIDTALDTQAQDSANGAAPEKKKKAHRGRRGGVKHKKNRAEGQSSRDDDGGLSTVDEAVDEAVSNAKKLGDRPSLEPDFRMIYNDMQAVTGSIISIGNIEVDTDVELGMGSNGTVVFAGRFDGRDVAVKRMTIQFYDIATRETRLLRESDDHPNVIRYYSQEMRGDFLYIALERCAASLADVIEKPNHFRNLANAGQKDLPAVLYQITNGITHLHSLRIVHRDLKPQNILVNLDKDGRPRLLVSDFGLCKKLDGTQSSFGATTGRAAGTTGWRAPELLLDDDGQNPAAQDGSTHSGSGTILVGDPTLLNGRRATRAIDIFSLGLVFFYVLTNGSHPFDCGDRYMREVNIRKGNYNLDPLDSLGDFSYEAKDLISSMLQADPKLRPTSVEVMAHPFFWSPKKRLAFLCDVSDSLEKEIRDPPSDALMELERHAPDVIRGDFLKLLTREFVDSLGKQRKYTGSKLLDLLRALRNKRNHYEDMSDSLKRSVGSLPDGYLVYWTVKFPMLLLTCWNVVYNLHWETSDRFREYYEPAGL